MPKHTFLWKRERDENGGGGRGKEEATYRIRRERVWLTNASSMLHCEGEVRKEKREKRREEKRREEKRREEKRKQKRNRMVHESSDESITSSGLGVSSTINMMNNVEGIRKKSK